MVDGAGPCSMRRRKIDFPGRVVNKHKLPVRCDRYNISVGMQQAPLPCSDDKVNHASEPLILNLNPDDGNEFVNHQSAENKRTQRIGCSVIRLHSRVQLLGAYPLSDIFSVPAYYQNFVKSCLGKKPIANKVSDTLSFPNR